MKIAGTPTLIEVLVQECDIERRSFEWFKMLPAAVPCCIQEPGPGMWRPVVLAIQPADKRQLGCYY